MKNKPPIGRVITPEARVCIQQTYHRKFTWKERFLIFIGYSATLNLNIPCRYDPVMTGNPTLVLLVTPTIIDKNHT